MHRTFKVALVGPIMGSLIILASALYAQPERWQQRAEYEMEIDMDVEKHQFSGFQKLVYYNNSPDTLNRAFYHLYFNAFQPGSMMDIRSRTIEDPDRRVGDRIFYLEEDEIGYHHISSLTMDGKPVDYEVVGTILECNLPEPILPGKKAVFEMEFDSQVPLQIRRSGRDNSEGVEFSMAQWYPKMAEYDYQGWHANPYVGREFYGIWGDFHVKITIDSSYVIGGSGYLQNPEEIGHGYLKAGEKLKRPKGGKLTWHFVAPNVHDFVWAADPDFKHTTHMGPNGLELHFFYQEDSLTQAWEFLPEYTAKAFEVMNEKFGQYPYKQYSVIQAGDGGMEYPMATLITGERELRSLVGVTVHELIHSWYQMVLGTNESLYAWMDEGFDSYASDIVMRELFKDDRRMSRMPPFYGSYRSYFALVESGQEEPLSTHADHFKTNRAYSIAAYSKGAVYLSQLGYVIGQRNLEKGLLRYFDTWKFKHPNANDFKRVMEKISGLELDWYQEYFVYTTKTIDYGIKSVVGMDDKTYVVLERVSDMIMPIDLEVEYKDGSKEVFYIPLQLLRGEKPSENFSVKRTVLEDWAWTNPTYKLAIPAPAASIRSITIDPTERMADVDRSNNIFSPEALLLEFE